MTSWCHNYELPKNHFYVKFVFSVHDPFFPSLPSLPSHIVDFPGVHFISRNKVYITHEKYFRGNDKENKPSNSVMILMGSQLNISTW